MYQIGDNTGSPGGLPSGSSGASGTISVQSPDGGISSNCWLVDTATGMRLRVVGSVASALATAAALVAGGYHSPS